MEKDEELTVEQKLNQYRNQGFNQAQLEEIRTGLEDELDVTFYARPDMPASEMMYIRKELFKRHITERQFEINLKEGEEDKATKELQAIKSRRELAYIAICLFVISVLVSIFTLII